MSLPLDDNHDIDNKEDELQDPKPALDTQSTDPTIDSNAVFIPVRHVEEQEIQRNTEQDPQYLIQEYSTLSTTNTNKTKPLIQPSISTNFDPPPSPESDVYTSSATSQQPSTVNKNINGLIKKTRPRFTSQSLLTPDNTYVTTHPYTQAQNTSDPNIPITFNINMIHTNPPPNNVNSRTLSRPPLQTIPTNPLQYNLSSTNTHTTQHSISSLQHNTQTTTSSNSTQCQNIPAPSTSSIRTISYFTPISQVRTNTNNLQSNTSHSNYHITHPYYQPSTTISNPLYITSSTSISEPIKSFDGLDHKYTPDEFLQHIEPRVTFFFSGLPPTTSHEFKLWHAQRMAFIQCSLTGTALSWYIRSNDTYKQDWSAFVHAFEKQFFLNRTHIMHKLKP